MAIDKRMRAAVSIVAARRLAQHDQRHVGNVAKFRQGIERNVWDDFLLIWRRMLLDNPQLDGRQLADAVEPAEPPAAIDPAAGARSAARARMQRNRQWNEGAPVSDPVTNRAGLLRARAALHPDNQ